MSRRIAQESRRKRLSLLNLTRERVRQLEVRALQKVRAAVERRERRGR